LKFFKFTHYSITTDEHNPYEKYAYRPLEIYVSIDKIISVIVEPTFRGVLAFDSQQKHNFYKIEIMEVEYIIVKCEDWFDCLVCLEEFSG